METKLWPIEHTAPSYPKAEFPLNLNLKVGDEWEYETEPPTEDVESVDFLVITDEPDDKFIKLSLDIENKTTITITP